VVRRILAIFVFVLVATGGARAQALGQDHQSDANSPTGTPKEQSACSPDAARYCSDDMPDTFKVLDCLKDHRAKLRKACREVLENHGQ